MSLHSYRTSFDTLLTPSIRSPVARHSFRLLRKPLMAAKTFRKSKRNAKCAGPDTKRTSILYRRGSVPLPRLPPASITSSSLMWPLDGISLAVPRHKRSLLFKVYTIECNSPYREHWLRIYFQTSNLGRRFRTAFWELVIDDSSKGSCVRDSRCTGERPILWAYRRSDFRHRKTLHSFGHPD